MRFGLILMVPALANCTDIPPTEPETQFEPTFAAAVGNAQGGRGLDAEFRRIAAEAPGFAGMHYGADGRLNVHVTAEKLRGPRGRQDVAASVARSLRANGRAAPSAIVFNEAEHEFPRLAAMGERMMGLFGVEGVVYTDIDEATNRLRVGVLAGTPTERIEQALAGLDIPADMVRVDVTPAIERLSGETLRDRVQPVGGGLQIVWEFSGVGFFVCTIGFNVLRDGPGRSEPHFLTNSHCTGDQGVVTGTEYYQPVPPQFLPGPPDARARTAQYNLLGVEVLDPPFFACGGGFVCRFSDAALVRYYTNNPVAFGTIYRTEFASTTGVGSIDIVQAGRKFFSISDEVLFPLGGEILDKMGRTTGWTRGQVFATCVNVLVSGTNQVLLCQDLVAGAAGGGDSGSPVFQPAGNARNATLYGLLWGGGPGLFAFSALDNIRFELGAFSTH